MSIFQRAIKCISETNKQWLIQEKANSERINSTKLNKALEYWCEKIFNAIIHVMIVLSKGILYLAAIAIIFWIIIEIYKAVGAIPISIIIGSIIIASAIRRSR